MDPNSLIFVLATCVINPLASIDSQRILLFSYTVEKKLHLFFPMLQLGEIMIKRLAAIFIRHIFRIWHMINQIIK